MRNAIDISKDAGWDAVFLVGEPAYYHRFGFSVDLASTFTSPYAGPYFMVLPLSRDFKMVKAPVGYAPAFQDL